MKCFLKFPRKCSESNTLHFVPTGCVPYSVETCKEIAKIMKRDYSSGNWGTKGCYYYVDGRYENDIFFGTGGTEAQEKSEVIGNVVNRPPGIDCSKG